MCCLFHYNWARGIWFCGLGLLVDRLRTDCFKDVGLKLVKESVAKGEEQKDFLRKISFRCLAYLERKKSCCFPACST